MVYGYRKVPGLYQTASRPTRGRRERGVVFRTLIVGAKHRTPIRDP